MAKRSPNAVRHPQTLALDHGKVVPPHCNASSRHTKAAMSNKAPGSSSLANFCFGVNIRDICGGVGWLQNTAMIRNDMKPIAKGRQYITT